MISIEQSIIKGLLFDEEYARKVVPHLKNEFFEGHHKEIFDLYIELHEKYNNVPSVEAMVVGLKGRGIGESVFESAMLEIETAIKYRSEKPDTQWLVDETEKYCIDKAMYNALYKSIAIIEGSDTKLDKHAIPSILEDALAISFDQTVGSDYLEDVLKRFEYYTNPESKLPFPLKALNILTNKGVPPKTLNIFLAGTNVGKSALMCFLAGEWLKAGKNVLYISMEMSEEAIQERIDANLLDMTTDELKNPNLNKDMFLKKVEALKSRTVGRLMCKEYPTGGAHAGHFRFLLKELKQKRKFKPDVIFIDYINICSSSRYKAGSGANSYTVVKAIAEELRGLAVEVEAAIFSATQTTRDGSNSQSPDLTATSESFGLPATADWMAAIVTNEELLESGKQLIIPLKSRYGNKKGLERQMVSIDFDKMRYSDCINDSSEDLAKSVGQRTPQNFNSATSTKKAGIPADIKWD
jgi:replicative DNA helicase